ncbi:MAG: hypothetical protein AAGP08_08410 [Pseudomonadota bacterium]
MSVRLGKGEVILAIWPSPIRRGIAIAAMVAIGVLFILSAINEELQGAIWRAILVCFGLGVFALARRFYLATSVGLELTRDALRDTKGRLLCTVAGVTRVDRGAFSMKPTNGLTIFVKEPGAFAWEPGLWWRWGRRVGIGGVTAAAQSKAIADTLALLLAERDGEDAPTSLI